MIFFFSSRRRHTRLQGDWSSDVCSSDLQASGGIPSEREQLREAQPDASAHGGHDHRRSEERRVGKEGKCRRPQGRGREEKGKRRRRMKTAEKRLELEGDSEKSRECTAQI